MQVHMKLVVCSSERLLLRSEDRSRLPGRQQFPPAFCHSALLTYQGAACLGRRHLLYRASACHGGFFLAASVLDLDSMGQSTNDMVTSGSSAHRSTVAARRLDAAAAVTATVCSHPAHIHLLLWSRLVLDKILYRPHVKSSWQSAKVVDFMPWV